MTRAIATRCVVVSIMVMLVAACAPSSSTSRSASALGIDRNALTPDTPIPASMSVDYVGVWRWAPRALFSSSS